MSSGETTGWQVHAIAQGSGGFLAAAPRGRSASPAVSKFSSSCLDEDAPVPGLVSVPCVCACVQRRLPARRDCGGGMQACPSTTDQQGRCTRCRGQLIALMK